MLTIDGCDKSSATFTGSSTQGDIEFVIGDPFTKTFDIAKVPYSPSCAEMDYSLSSNSSLVGFATFDSVNGKIDVYTSDS